MAASTSLSQGQRALAVERRDFSSDHGAINMIPWHPPRHRPIQPWVRATQSRAAGSGALHYREYTPPPNLGDLLINVWTLTGSGGKDRVRSYHVVPDGCSDLIFDRNAGEGYIFGTISKSKTVDMSGSVSIVGLRLQPHLLRAFTGIPPAAVRNVEPSFDEASLEDWNDLFERHAENANKGFDRRSAESLAHAVAAKLRPERINSRAKGLTTALLVSSGSVDAAAQKTGYSTRQLQRISQQNFGLSPKRFGRILRLQQTFPAIFLARDNQALIAAEHGYADQAHMIREFTTLTGYAPGFWHDRWMSDLSNSPAPRHVRFFSQGKPSMDQRTPQHQ